MLQATQNQQQQPSSNLPTAAAATPPPADFFSHVGRRTPVPQVHPRSFSVGAADEPLPDNGNVENSNGEAAGGSDVRRSKSMKTPARANLTGMSSFAAAGSNLAGSSSPGPPATTYAPPAAARHPLFSHHAIAPVAPVSERSLSPALTVMSDPGPDQVAHLASESSRPISPTESTVSSFSPASVFLTQFSSRTTDAPLPDAQGSRFLDYVLGKVLGRGGFSTVRLATHVENGEAFACKIVRRDDLSDTSGSLESFEQEIILWKSLPQHKNLMPLLDVHRTSYATFLLMPLMPGGSLLDVLQREGGSEKTARKWFPGVVDAVTALHEGFEGFDGHILHGDLKLDNFMVDPEGIVRLGDFGMARPLSSSTKRHPPDTLTPNGGRGSHLAPHVHARDRIASTPQATSRLPSRSPHRRRDTLASADVDACHTPPCPSASLPYAPPELLGSVPVVPSLARDIWAVGIILHALLTNRLPFTDSFDPRLQMKILRGQWEQPHNVGFEWMEVLHGCLHRDARRRWDIRHVRECDALVGWQQVKPRMASRSRSRARIAPDPTLDHRGRRAPDSPVLHRGSYPGDSVRGRSRSAARLAAHHRGPSYDELHAAQHERDAKSRSRSKSANRNPHMPGPHRGRPGVPHHLDTTAHGLSPRFTPDRLAAELEGVAITRGRSKQRFEVPPRDSSTSSLNVPTASRTSASRSPSAPRRPLSQDILGSSSDGKRAPSRPRSGHSVPGSAAWWDMHDRENVSGTSSGAHTPSRAGSRTRGSPGRPSPTDPFIPGQQGSRPPTLGFELEVVDEDAPARARGRSPARSRAAGRSKSRGRLQG